MLLEPILLSIVVGKLRKGKIKNIESINIKRWYFFVLAVLVQLLLALTKKFSINFNRDLFDNMVFFSHIIVFLLLLIGIISNIKLTSMKLFAIGFILNFLVMFFNGGQMPVSQEGISGINNYMDLPERQFDTKHIPITSDSKLVYLADIILIPKPYPLPKVISVGDIFIMLGAFVIFQESMIKKEEDKIKA